MTDLLTWLSTHRVELVEAAGAVYLLASIYVSITPGKEDDAALGRFRACLERLSFLQPADGEGVLSAPGRPAKRSES